MSYCICLVDPTYDAAKREIAQIENSIEQHLKEMKKVTGINDLKYWGSNKDRYQIEVPINQVSKVPRDWSSKSQKKTHRRYWNPTIEGLLESLLVSEEKANLAQKDMLRSIFAKFDESRNVWRDGLACAANLDSLISLALVSSSPGYNWATFEDPTTSVPLLHITGGRHAMLEHAFSQR